MANPFKCFLVTLITVSVVSDALLLPFYPQFFRAAFAMDDPWHIGLYLSATCLVVMLAFVLWARVAKHIPVLRLLVYTQCAAGLLSIACYGAQSLADFWLLSLLMLGFKGSYLLIYPYIMSLETQDKHGGTVGLLAVLVHLGAILGAAAGGLVLELLAPRQAFLLMAAGDFMQMLICCGLLAVRMVPVPLPETAMANPPRTVGLYPLGMVMLLFYFSVSLGRPFFSSYWQTLSPWQGETVTGLVFALPGAIALVALCLGKNKGGLHGVSPALGLCAIGLACQAIPHPAVVLVGRCLYGWGLFQATVYLDVCVFAISTPSTYTRDFSKIYFCQSVGALLAALAAGRLVADYPLSAPFLVGAAALLPTLLIYLLLFRPRALHSLAVSKP
ncbi:MFS transporter [Methylovulum psychrotolerans]|uniref:MFS transporter n=1 Tax=Methylovulum psychrotolerans TaxID=1704499 RepID=A0A1Z4BYK0_9GAMM|nr:MFS transporter [Methylovulum psychrotolerans]ASF46329.1 MFS transporter [Methylovulum psychrotolerans]